jgi:phosphoribosylcarboxyaminoimidazole (NCAIR) mutase
VYVVLQVLDEQGNVEKFDKKRIRIVSAHRDPHKMLASEDENPDSFRLAIVLPPGARAGIPNKPKPVEDTQMAAA